MSTLFIIDRLISFYQLLIIVYILMSWLRPSTGIIYDVYHALGTIAEPWLGIFRRFVPPLGMIDISPIIAIVVLDLIQSLLYRLG